MPLTIKQFAGLHLFELAYLGVLAVLPFIVAKPVVGLTVLGILLVVGLTSLFKRVTFRKVSLEEKSVLVTGCDSGFGHAIAKCLSTNGLMVFAGCLNPDSDGARKLGISDNIEVIPLDVTSEQSVNNALEIITRHSEFKGLWSLINNAGISFIADVEFCSVEMYKRVADVNLFGTIRVTKTFIPLLRKQQGRVINVTSSGICYPRHSAHAMTKAGASAFTNSLRVEMRKFGIKVITVEPGNFYGATGLLNKSALNSMEVSIPGLYNKASKEIQEVYGSEYLHKAHANTVGFSSTAFNSLAPVVEALEEAVISTRPSSNYLVDGSKFIDIHNWLLRLRPLLPLQWIDSYLDREFLVEAYRHKV